MTLRTLLLLLLVQVLVTTAVHSSFNSRSSIRLGSECQSHFDCSAIQSAHCRDKLCSCLPYHVPLNSTACVRGSLLGFPCQLDTQCHSRVPHSHCINGMCACGRHYVPHRRDFCLRGSRLGELCANNAQCQLVNKLSHCKLSFHNGYGHCACLPGFHTQGNFSCGSTLGIECHNDKTCRALTPHAECVHTDGSTSICMCARGYTVARSGKKCIPKGKGLPDVAVSLGKKCYNSEQCQARDPNSHCSKGVCQCIINSPKCNANHTGCFEDTFQCRSGQCISWYFVCNSVKNCADGSDEDECMPHHCPKEAYQCKDGTCIPRSKVCNGRKDCNDASDEAKCFDDCDTKAFRCGDRACLPQYAYCNAIASCRDGSDELASACDKGGESCPPNTFRCNNGRCRSHAILCSGKNGCGDNSDEAKCNVCYCPKA